VVTGPRVNAVAIGVTTSAFSGGATVRLLSTALPQTFLRAAHLASIRAEPCSGGVAFVATDTGTGPFFGIERDGVQVTQGPLDIGGQHELALWFQSQDVWAALKTPLRGSSAVDLDVEFPGGHDCLRVPLGADSPESRWKPNPTSPAFLFAIGARAFPFSGAVRAAAEPIAAAYERLGTTSEAGDLFVEGWGGGSTNFGFLALGAGGNRVIWSEGPWSLTAGAAYEVVFSIHADPSSHALDYVLHGPRLTPALTWSPLATKMNYPGFPLGRRSHGFELELPVSGWFGTGVGAPTFVLAPGVGVNFHLVF
jgi:hypothetical protein